jgi:hypothetical protein
MLASVAEEGEDRHRIVRVLLFHHREIDRLAIETRRRASFQAALRQLQFFQSGRQRDRRRIAHPATGVVFQTDVNLAVEEGSCGQHDRIGQKADAQFGDCAATLTFDDQVVAGIGEKRQIGLVFQSTADGLLVQHTVGLGASRAHRRAFRGVEDAELDTGFVGSRGHRPAQRIDFAHQVALANAADRRIAAHRPQRVEVVGQQQRIRPRPRCGKRSFGAGMAAADNNDIETGGEKHEGDYVAAQYREGNFTSGR